MHLPDAGTSSYDELPYGNQTISETCPASLAAIGRLFGVPTSPPFTAKVLELGCAEGGNLLPMAVAFPGATFVGVDLSASQIARGEARREALGIGNVSLRVGDVTRLGPELGTFDYVLAHGLFSWIPEAAAEALLGLVGRTLAPAGLAYVSYNTFPGWHLKGLVRDILLRGTRSAASPTARLASARELLAFVAAHSADRSPAYGQVLRDGLEDFSRYHDAYLFHDWLESDNHPCWFLDFVAAAARHGLAPVADAHLAAMPMGSVKPDLDALLSDRARGRLEKEALLDVLRSRTFRQTLLVRAPGPGLEEPDPAALDDLRFTSDLAPVESSGPGTTFRSPVASVSTDNPVLVAALQALDAARPRALCLEELAPGRADALRTALLRCVALALVQARVGDVPCATSAGEAPLASPVARLEAAEGPHVTSLSHHDVVLDPSARLLLRELDGRPRAAIARSVAEIVVAERQLVRPDGAPPSPEEARATVEEGLDGALSVLARHALLLR